MKTTLRLLVAFLVLITMACQPDDDIGQNDGGNNGPDINEVDDPTPQDNDMVTLGRLLFWDPILSGAMDVSCATCHHPDLGYADGRELSIGIDGEGLGLQRQHINGDQAGFVRRNSPTILNTAFNGMNQNGNFNPATAPMFWDNRVQSLETQALEPIKSFEEMRGHGFGEAVILSEIVERLQANTQYVGLFAEAFGGDNTINSNNIGIAIATFERSLIATNSPFDDFQAGDQNAMTQQQQRGMNRFNQIGCDDCHSGPMFSDFQLHTIGMEDNDLLGGGTDDGANGNYAFRTPTLRNLGFTGPYFHNGVGRNLEETIDFYITARNFANGNNGGGGGGNNGIQINPNLNPNDIDNDVQNLNNFNNGDIDDIVAFIEALNDPGFDRTIPNSVPSGLNVGGNID